MPLILGQNIEIDISGCFFVAIVIITFKTIVKEAFNFHLALIG